MTSVYLLLTDSMKRDTWNSVAALAAIFVFGCAGDVLQRLVHWMLLTEIDHRESNTAWEEAVIGMNNKTVKPAKLNSSSLEMAELKQKQGRPSTRRRGWVGALLLNKNGWQR